MTEAIEKRTPFASMGYEPVGAITTKLIARYLRTQRKNMRRFFQERGLYVLADRMNQIRKSRQGMLAKNRMFQGVLNDYAALSMPSRTEGSEPLGSVPNLRTNTIQGVAENESGIRTLSLDGVAESEPGKTTGDPEQTLRVPDSDPIIAEDL